MHETSITVHSQLTLEPGIDRAKSPMCEIVVVWVHASSHPGLPPPKVYTRSQTCPPGQRNACSYSGILILLDALQPYFWARGYIHDSTVVSKTRSVQYGKKENIYNIWNRQRSIFLINLGPSDLVGCPISPVESREGARLWLG